MMIVNLKQLNRRRIFQWKLIKGLQLIEQMKKLFLNQFRIEGNQILELLYHFFMFFRNFKIFKIHSKFNIRTLLYKLIKKGFIEIENQFTFNQICQILTTTTMSDDQVAFENWEDAAEQLEKQQLDQKQQTQQQQNKQLQIPDVLSQQQKEQKKPEDPKEILKKKIELYQKMELHQFQQISQQLTQTNKTAAKKVGNPVLKSDKDFNNYAKILAKRFDSMVQNEDATIDDDKLSLFFEELSLYMYKNLEWKNLHEIQSKIKVLKKERKVDEEKRRKQKEKQERLKKVQGQGSESQSQSVSKQQKKDQDLFGGVGTINSKQEQEERKNKIITQEIKKQEKQGEDDDDFM